MSKKTICDKCGKETRSQGSFGDKTLRITGLDINQIVIDLCVNCLKEIGLDRVNNRNPNETKSNMVVAVEELATAICEEIEYQNE